MDLGTLREQIKRTTSRRSASDDHHVNDHIAKAIRKYYRKTFRFNTLTINIALNGERTEVSPDGNLSISDGGDPEVITYYYPWDLLRFKRMSRIDTCSDLQVREYSLTGLTGTFSNALTGLPRGLAWDGEILVVRPVVEPGFEVEFNYMADVTRPVVKFTDGIWTLLDSITGEKMDDDTTSPWFDEAQDLIHWAAVYLLNMGIYGDAEKAQMAKVMEREAYKELMTGDQITSEPRGAKPHYV